MRGLVRASEGLPRVDIPRILKSLLIGTFLFGRDPLESPYSDSANTLCRIRTRQNPLLALSVAECQLVTKCYKRIPTKLVGNTLCGFGTRTPVIPLGLLGLVRDKVLQESR